MAIRTKAPEAAPAALPGATQVETPAQHVPAEASISKAAKDYKAEERARVAGQVRMHCIVAALQSPAGPAFAPTAEAYLDLVKKLADMAFEFTFQGEGK